MTGETEGDVLLIRSGAGMMAKAILTRICRDSVVMAKVAPTAHVLRQ